MTQGLDDGQSMRREALSRLTVIIADGKGGNVARDDRRRGEDLDGRGGRGDRGIWPQAEHKLSTS